MSEYLECTLIFYLTSSSLQLFLPCYYLHIYLTGQQSLGTDFLSTTKLGMRRRLTYLSTKPFSYLRKESDIDNYCQKEDKHCVPRFDIGI